MSFAELAEGDLIRPLSEPDLARKISHDAFMIIRNGQVVTGTRFRQAWSAIWDTRGTSVRAWWSRPRVHPTSGLEKSFDDLFSIACIKGWNEQTQVRGISDGARHIRPHMEVAFDIGNFRFILDRPHCKEHLSSAGEALESTTGVPAQQWADQALKKLEAGEAAAVVAELKQAWEASGPDKKPRNDTLRLEAGYFERNQDAVAYAYYRDNGWSTASSEVESGHRHVVQVRVKISGAWWHPDHVDDILALRMLKANGWWDAYWHKQLQRWRQTADEFRATRPRTKLALVA